ncbi:hypothetical protein K435DRAFT_886375 [Dendrothele bispora CBS 962.96]|uniref:F-box domain-containing protein n=1 Tax=Dendrothele bispora (strain CBS 962.96) TaxID=1314807 RepID=A0A4S8MSS8_DENBC|nr:hypothetical protein K435DRAFT_886375 [Dendrothele bispora CBS 962.96]
MSSQNPWIPLPTELVLQILACCDPRDVASLSMTNRFFWDFIYSSEDSYFWRQLLLTHYDDPQKAHRFSNTGSSSSSSRSDIDWKTQIQNRTEVEIIALSNRHWEPTEHVLERRRALETFIFAVEDALPCSKDCARNEPSWNVIWLNRVLTESRILQLPTLPNESQLCSRLRSYTALTHASSSSDEPMSETNPCSRSTVRTRSRCYVYDFRRYNLENNWGPFLPDGSVNWNHVENIVNVMLMNIRELPGPWMADVPPLGLEATRAFSAPGNHREEDWAGVEGTWRRYVCFMDYRDLFEGSSAFNYSTIAGGPRNPIFFTDSRFREATRLIEVKLHLIPRDQFHFGGYDVQTESSPNSLYPTLYFAGSSRGLSGVEAAIEGYVRDAGDGIVRWRFFDSIQGVSHSGRMQWCSHGIQLGNVQSAMGVVGNFSTTDHDEGDPVGPYWLFKVPDGYTGRLLDYV